jgi:hypothetical protein
MSDATRDLRRRGKKTFEAHLPDQDFDAHVWEISPLREQQSISNERIYWTLRGSQDDSLPEHFAAPIKAACMVDLQSCTNLVFRSDAARMLWEHLRKKEDPSSSFRWERLTEGDLRGMEREMLEHWAESTTYKTCTAWSRVLEVLSTASVIRPMDIKWQTSRPEDSERYTLDGQEKRKEEHLPSDRSIEAVAHIYSNDDLDLDSSDRLLSCVTALLTATGLRVGEILTLPVDPLSKSTRNGDTRWHLQYWPEKTGKATREKDLLHLTERPASLVSEVIDEIQEITSSARQRARVLEQNPGRAPIDDLSPDDLLTTEAVQELLDLADGSATARVRRTGIPILERDREGYKRPEYLCRVSDIEEYLQERQGDLWTINPDGGNEQMLSDSLFVVHTNFFHATRGTKSILVDTVSLQHVGDFLSGRWTSCDEDHEEAERHNGEWMRCVVPSIFRQLGLKEEDGSHIEMTSHQFRHWLTTNLVDSGVPDGIIARWQNRGHEGDISAYKHATRTDRIREVKDAIESGRMQGEIADIYFAMAEDIRDAWLDSHLQQIHVTHMGLCTHDFSSSPCPHHLQCLNGCSDFLFDPADEEQRENVEEIVEGTREAIQLAEKQEGDNAQWMRHQKKILSNGLKVLEFEEDPESSHAQPFEGEGSNFEPFEDDDFIPIEEAREELEEDTES